MAGISITSLVCGAALISGGLGSGALGLLVAGPIIVWLVWGRDRLGGAVLSAIVGGSVLAILQMTGLLPPALPGIGAVLELISVATLAVVGTLTVFKSGRTQAPPAIVQNVAVQPGGMPDDWPALFVDISELGRIRRVAGDLDIWPGLSAGQLAEQVLVDQTGSLLTKGRKVSKTGVKLLVTEAIRATGRVLVLLPEAGFESGSDPKMAQQLRERTDFFAGLGHDLKSPLNAVIGFSEMMESEIRGPMPDAYKEYPALIRESGQTLLRLVEDMLDYAKSEAGTYEIDPSPMDVTSSGEAVLRQSQADAARAGVQLEIKAPGQVLVQADARAVHRIWDNLVSNAIKYSNPDGVVTLAVSPRGRDVAISVTDRGAGMDADDLKHVAKPFEQGRNARGRAGIGLGLAMVQRLANMHGGQVMIRTAPGEGTQVTVTLPAAINRLRGAAE